MSSLQPGHETATALRKHHPHSDWTDRSIVYTYKQYASFCERRACAFIGRESDFCRMCMLLFDAECVWFWKRVLCVYSDAESFFFFFLGFRFLNVKCSLHSNNPADWFIFILICSFEGGFEFKLAQQPSTKKTPLHLLFPKKWKNREWSALS